MRRYLVVANQTLGGQHLIEKVRQCVAEGPCHFHCLVPATHSEENVLTWTEGEATAVAQVRLDRALERFRELGADVGGEIGDPNPIRAIEDVLSGAQFDELILSTLPSGISSWLKLDLPSRVASRFGLPVTHVVGDVEPVAVEE
jgi:hypothetical protein